MCLIQRIAESDGDNVERFLTHKQFFMNHVYNVPLNFELDPSKDYNNACINFADLFEYAGK